MRFRELLRAAEQVPTPIEVKGRRRPGRNNQVSPHLIPLLRDPATVHIPEPQPGIPDSRFIKGKFAHMKHICFGIVLSVPLWAIIVGIVWIILR